MQGIDREKDWLT